MDDLTPEETAAAIDRIDREAFQLALAVHEDPTKRSLYATQARERSEELLTLSARLKREDPEAHALRKIAISESIIDLKYAREEIPICSLRLGRHMRRMGE